MTSCLHRNWYMLWKLLDVANHEQPCQFNGILLLSSPLVADYEHVSRTVAFDNAQTLAADYKVVNTTVTFDKAYTLVAFQTRYRIHKDSLSNHCRSLKLPDGHIYNFSNVPTLAVWFGLVFVNTHCYCTHIPPDMFHSSS